MKKIIILVAFITACLSLNAQKYFTRNGQINFESDAPLEKIEARNTKVTSVIDLTTGKLEFAVLIKAFQFEKALMQEHFNENYMESSKYPKAIFKGEIKNFNFGNINSQEFQKVLISGDLTIHGVTQHIDTEANLKIMPEEIIASSVLLIQVSDFAIKIPNLVKDNLAKEIKIIVDMVYKPLNR